MTDNHSDKVESFVFYRSFYDIAEDVSPVDFGRLMYMISAYALNDEEFDLASESHDVRMAFKLIKPQLDANKRKRANGKKGGRKSTTVEVEEVKPDEIQEVKEEIKKALPAKAIEVAEKLQTFCKEKDTKFKTDEKQIYRWAEDIEKINRIDNREWNQIEQVLDYVKHDTFWGSVVLSGNALRRDFPKIVSKMAINPISKLDDDVIDEQAFWEEQKRRELEEVPIMQVM